MLQQISVKIIWNLFNLSKEINVDSVGMSSFVYSLLFLYQLAIQQEVMVIEVAKLFGAYCNSLIIVIAIIVKQQCKLCMFWSFNCLIHICLNNRLSNHNVSQMYFHNTAVR